MKKILITGANSYIGTSFDQWMKQWPNSYMVDTIDMIDGSWRDKNFSEYDVVLHVAGIAHVDTKNATNEVRELYYRVNRDLTTETATKAKKDGVGQFIFMSSIIVYGDSSPIGENRVITCNTKPNPSNFYGDSKLQAENRIIPMQSNDFNIVVLRPPMIYGKGSKGNYPTLAKIAKKIAIFPNMNNQRSMLYVDNLCELIRLIIDKEDRGIFYPQNCAYISTSNLLNLIAKAHGKKVIFTRIFNPFMRIFSKIPGRLSRVLNKVFGNSVYDISMSNHYGGIYRVKNFEESINETEG